MSFVVDGREMLKLKWECRSNYCEISVDYFPCSDGENFSAAHNEKTFNNGKKKRKKWIFLNCIICGWSGNSVFETCLFLESRVGNCCCCCWYYWWWSKRQRVEKLFSFSVEIPQHPSENIYSVLAFINILIKRERNIWRKKPTKRTNKEFPNAENLIGKTTTFPFHLSCSFSHASFISLKE